MGVSMDLKESQYRLHCPQTYQVANNQPSTFTTIKRRSFWLSKTPSFASIHYNGESGRLDEFVLKFSQNRFALRQRYKSPISDWPSCIIYLFTDISTPPHPHHPPPPSLILPPLCLLGCQPCPSAGERSGSGCCCCRD